MNKFTPQELYQTLLGLAEEHQTPLEEWQSPPSEPDWLPVGTTINIWQSHWFRVEGHDILIRGFQGCLDPIRVHISVADCAEMYQDYVAHGLLSSKTDVTVAATFLLTELLKDPPKTNGGDQP